MVTPERDSTGLAWTRSGMLWRPASSSRKPSPNRLPQNRLRIAETLRPAPFRPAELVDPPGAAANPQDSGAIAGNSASDQITLVQIDNTDRSPIERRQDSSP